MDGVTSRIDRVTQEELQRKRGWRDEEDPDLEPGDEPPPTQGNMSDVFRQMSKDMTNF